MSRNELLIRPVVPGDALRWRELWDGYCRFYERSSDQADAIAEHTWKRILDPHSPVHAIVAEHALHGVVGMANYLIHENTATLSPVCYLQDLFVDPQQRAGGVGRALIDWLVAESARQGWSRLYWNTRENNYRARGLYDQYTPHSGFVRYVLNLPGR
ncbi:N-acetyltransferase family protein [Chitinimonas sp.]|uniref:GNAT family N-acetyltransferase n=1 Tax=Chitinimonas sp. TaxID=1934313 RepID=UPI0035B1A80A